MWHAKDYGSNRTGHTTRAYDEAIAICSPLDVVTFAKNFPHEIFCMGTSSHGISERIKVIIHIGVRWARPKRPAWMQYDGGKLAQGNAVVLPYPVKDQDTSSTSSSVAWLELLTNPIPGQVFRTRGFLHTLHNHCMLLIYFPCSVS